MKRHIVRLSIVVTLLLSCGCAEASLASAQTDASARPHAKPQVPTVVVQHDQTRQQPPEIVANHGSETPWRPLEATVNWGDTTRRAQRPPSRALLRSRKRAFERALTALSSGSEHEQTDACGLIASLVTDAETSRRALLAIENFLSVSENAPAVNRCFIALARIDPAQAKAFFDTQEPQVKGVPSKVALVEASVVLDNRSDPSSLVRLAGDREDPAIRGASLYVMAQEHMPQALPVVKALLQSRDHQTIATALPAATAWADAFKPDLLRVAADRNQDTNTRTVALGGLNITDISRPEDLHTLSSLAADTNAPDVSAMAATLIHPGSGTQTTGAGPLIEQAQSTPRRHPAAQADVDRDTGTPHRPGGPRRPGEAVTVCLVLCLAGLFALAALLLQKEKRISELRQAWMDAVFHDLLRFLALANRILGGAVARDPVSSIGVEQPQNRLVELSEILSSLRLRLDPEDTLAKDLGKALLSLQELFLQPLGKDPGAAASVIRDRLKEVEQTGSRVLNRERRALETGGRWSSAIALVVAVVTAAAAAGLVYAVWR